MINFNYAVLVKKYGSWVRVQIEFYDFIFKTASQMCAAHFNRHGLFFEGEDFYDEVTEKIEKMFKTTEDAWIAFNESMKDKL